MLVGCAILPEDLIGDLACGMISRISVGFHELSTVPATPI